MKSAIDLDMNVADGSALPVDPTILLPRIIQYYLSEGQAADGALDPQFMNAGCRAHQIMRLMEFSSTELDFKLSIWLVAHRFNIDHSAVKQVLLRAYEDAPGRGRHRELLPEVGHSLVKWIAKKVYDNKAVNRTKLLNYGVTTVGTAITRGCVDSFMSRDAVELFETKSFP
jgi:hypothetical protein